MGNHFISYLAIDFSGRQPVIMTIKHIGQLGPVICPNGFKARPNAVKAIYPSFTPRCIDRRRQLKSRTQVHDTCAYPVHPIENWQVIGD